MEHYRSFSLPVDYTSEEEHELNKFLAHRITRVEKEFSPRSDRWIKKNRQIEKNKK